MPGSLNSAYTVTKLPAQDIERARAFYRDKLGLERFTDRRAAAVVVGGLDEQPPGVSGAGLGDRPEPALRAGGVL